ncbi:MAG: DUF302 domain-containing protein [Candidatus Marinimicrobia bacterium]|nr:DUF302 domain-containing protein [Candidatus Neomarinimicrobiota bacterium]MBL7023703.1 DUF302 domain-containing protein [Candidatus Neomarinimicrobiota bacterium]MBL7110009.1 DUF302 domain-containing protein [Candidatus Neomarinimicrobiota bacterium]
MKYGYFRNVNSSFSITEDKIKIALKEQGFGVMTEIDVRKTIKEKLNIDYKQYKILGVCNPPLAHQALENEPDIGLLLPCNVIVVDNEDGTTKVGAIDTHSMMSVTGREDMLTMANHINELLQNAVDSL